MKLRISTMYVHCATLLKFLSSAETRADVILFIFPNDLGTLQTSIKASYSITVTYPFLFKRNQYGKKNPLATRFMLLIEAC